MGPAGSRRIPRAPRYSGAVLRGASRFAYGTVTLCGAGFHRASATLGSCARRRSYNPGRGQMTAPVWANARSLATTCAIIVIFSSSGYLDVSVPRVRPPPLTAVWRDRSRRVSPFGHPRVAGYLPLTAAFRSLSRPSSPPRATGIPHAPFFSFLDVFRLQTFSHRAPRNGGLRARSLFYSLLSFFASISRLAPRRT